MGSSKGYRVRRQIFRGLILSLSVTSVWAQAIDPGVRHASTDRGLPPPLANLTADELIAFQDGETRFAEVESVVSGAGAGQNSGLGPRFNSNQCVSCHSQPFAGGTSPAVNPLFTVANAAGATNIIPWFIVPNGPAREARFLRSINDFPNGAVNELFVITGRSDAGSCNIQQPNFLPAGNGLTGQGGNPNIIFRIPTSVLGDGLIEAIPDSAILSNMRDAVWRKQQLGIAGQANRSANDGTITRFGWKAQNKSMLQFAGEAYNVELGISNQLFPQERDETLGCLGRGNATPNDHNNFPQTGTNDHNNFSQTGTNDHNDFSQTGTGVLADIAAFADFMRMVAPAVPAESTESTRRGRHAFERVGCAECHTPMMTTGRAVASGSATSPSVAMSNQRVHLFSDLLVHHMGTGLADGVTQGAAGPDQFRSAPLWGVGQRIFFLHDGRTTDLIQAIHDHASPGSEANQVVQNFMNSDEQEQQDLINFLRSL